MLKYELFLADWKNEASQSLYISIILIPKHARDNSISSEDAQLQIRIYDWREMAGEKIKTGILTDPSSYSYKIPPLAREWP